MKSKLRKAGHVYRNHGLKGLSKKSRAYVSHRRRQSHNRPRSLEEKELLEEYGFVSNDIFQITSQDLELSRQATCGPKQKKVETATWFVPHYAHFGFNGIQTIFRFMEKLSVEGVSNNIVIYDNPAIDKEQIKRDISSHFPRLNNYKITVFGDDKDKSLQDLPSSDIAFCTMWVSAYILLRFNKTKRKYYFIQDYEPLFYVAGSTYALAESTYRFGFEGIVNTPGLLESIRERHSMNGVSFVPAANHEVFYPAPNRQPNKRVRIVFYARPGNPRNAFNLSLLTAKHLLDKYGDRIEIVAAGADWDEAEYGLKGQIENRGLIKSLTEVADLYRTCDIGFSYMMNKHTTYQFFDYTSCGVAVVMNKNEDHLWLHKHEKNCLLAEPSPSAMAEQIGRLVDDPSLRTSLVTNAAASIEYTWDEQLKVAWDYLKKTS